MRHARCFLHSLIWGLFGPALTLSPLLLSFQKGWMKSQDPSLPVASSVTRMAFFSSRAGSRLFTVRYLLLFMWRSWKGERQGELRWYSPPRSPGLAVPRSDPVSPFPAAA